MVDIQLVCKYKLDRQIALQSRAFFNGMADVIDAKCGLTASIVEPSHQNLLEGVALRLHHDMAGPMGTNCRAAHVRPTRTLSAHRRRRFPYRSGRSARQYSRLWIPGRPDHAPLLEGCEAIQSGAEAGVDQVRDELCEASSVSGIDCLRFGRLLVFCYLIPLDPSFDGVPAERWTDDQTGLWPSESQIWDSIC